MKNTSLVLQWITLALAALLFIGSFLWFAAPVIDCPACPELPKLEIPSVNLTSVEDRLTDIETTLNEDEDWKDIALDLATAEWEKRDYNAIYRAIADIDDRNDIEYVTIKDEEVTSFDVDDQDAEVRQFVKVRYENDVGNDVKIYFLIETLIEEGEADIINIEEVDSDFKL